MSVGGAELFGGDAELFGGDAEWRGDGKNGSKCGKKARKSLLHIKNGQKETVGGGRTMRVGVAASRQSAAI